MCVCKDGCSCMCVTLGVDVCVLRAGVHVCVLGWSLMYVC